MAMAQLDPLRGWPDHHGSELGSCLTMMAHPTSNVLESRDTGLVHWVVYLLHAMGAKGRGAL
jgi:hypothetical protein